MPWSGSSFAERHNHGLHGGKATHAAHIANAVLRSGVPEGESIAIANKWAQRHANGGIVARRDDGGGIGGIAPSAQTMNPLVQNSIQQFSQLPTEKLAELAARLGPTQQGRIAQQILQQKRMMPPAPVPAQQQQQQQPQQSTPPQGYRRGGAPAARASGGDMGLSPSQGSPWWTRSEARGADSGFLHGTTPGRADSVQTTAPGGAYVLPAEVIAGLGEGNSLSGARIADAMFSTGPHGTPMPRGGRGMGPPRAPAPFREQVARGGPIKLFKGGVADDQEVLLSHGEYVISPQFCEALGTRKDKDGKIIPEPAAERRKRAHRWLDKWTVEQNKKHIVALKKYPGPVKT